MPRNSPHNASCIVSQIGKLILKEGMWFEKIFYLSHETAPKARFFFSPFSASFRTSNLSDQVLRLQQRSSNSFLKLIGLSQKRDLSFKIVLSHLYEVKTASPYVKSLSISSSGST